MSSLVKAIVSPFQAVASAIFGGDDDDNYSPPPMPAPAPTTPAPKAPTEEDTLQAQAEERKRLAAMKGKSSNLATAGGWQGLGAATEDDQQMGKTVKRTLLG